MARWKMATMCANCPFAAEGPGLRLRNSLAKRRWAGILRALRSDLHFICHHTSDATGDGTNLVCAGALEWQQKRGLASNYQRVCERLDTLSRRHNG